MEGYLVKYVIEMITSEMKYLIQTDLMKFSILCNYKMCYFYVK